jgi:hypothetical protein
MSGSSGPLSAKQPYLNVNPNVNPIDLRLWGVDHHVVGRYREKSNILINLVLLHMDELQRWWLIY